MAKCNWGIHIPMYSPFVMYRHVCLYTYRTTHHSISYETTTPGKYDSTKLSRRETWLCLWTSRFSFGSSTSHIFECVSPTYLSQRRFFKTFPARDESCEHDSFEHAAWKCQGHISWRRFLFFNICVFYIFTEFECNEKNSDHTYKRIRTCYELVPNSSVQFAMPYQHPFHGLEEKYLAKTRQSWKR